MRHAFFTALSLTVAGGMVSDSCFHACAVALSGHETISIGAGKEPTFAWSADEPVHGVTVKVYESGAIVWGVFCPGEADALVSPVTYGVTPPGTRRIGNILIPLATGLKYRVTISRTNYMGAIVAVAETTFTR